MCIYMMISDLVLDFMWNKYKDDGLLLSFIFIFLLYLNIDIHILE